MVDIKTKASTKIDQILKAWTEVNRTFYGKNNNKI